MSDLAETSVYLTTSENFSLKKEVLDKFLEFCNVTKNFDLIGAIKPLNYDGEAFPESVFMEFDVTQEELNDLWRKAHSHRNITLYGWQEESSLKEIVDTIQDIIYQTIKESIYVDEISLLIGAHYIFALDDSASVKTSFSLAFLLDVPVKDVEKVNLALRRDSQFCDQLAILSEYFGTKFSIKIGLS